MIDIIYHLGTPVECEYCGRTIKRGQRAVVNGRYAFDTCECAVAHDHGASIRAESAQA